MLNINKCVTALHLDGCFHCSRLEDQSFTCLLKAGSVVNLSIKCVVVNPPGHHCVAGQKARTPAGGDSLHR